MKNHVDIQIPEAVNKMLDIDASLPVYLNQLCLVCIKITATPPTQTARILAMIHAAMYDAWTMYQDSSQPYRLSMALRRPEHEHRERYYRPAIVYAAYRVIHACFYLPLLAENKEVVLKDAMDALGLEYKDFALNPRTPEGIGNLAGQAMLDYYGGDGSNVWNTMGGKTPYADYTCYQPTLTPGERPTEETWGDWQPLNVPQPGDSAGAIQQFLTPHWGVLKPFALKNGWEFRPYRGPNRTAASIKHQSEVLIRASEHLNDEQKAIAEFWQGGPNEINPPGHWCQLAAYVSERDEHGTGQAVRLYFALANALYDASIAAWDSKRYFDYVRPVTAIRHLYRGETIRSWGGHRYGGVVYMRGEQWHPYQEKYFVTPPFAEYPSGHSVFSGAAAGILERFRGTNSFGASARFAANTSKIQVDTPSEDIALRWDTFSSAAKEAGMSRIYGGIHFEKGNRDGLRMGAKVADKVWKRCNALWKGCC